MSAAALNKQARKRERRRKLYIYSPSQVDKFLVGCRRKWWFEYPGGIKEPVTESRKYGLKIHDEIHQWHESRKSPKDPRSWAALDALGIDARTSSVPKDVATELRIDVDLGPSKQTGLPRVYREIIDHVDVSTDPPTLTDHKTSSDKKYAKTEYELAEDVQMLSYAHWLFSLEPTLSEVKVQHNFIPTRGAPKAYLTDTIVEREHVESKWKKYLKVIDQMDVVRTMRVEDVPADGINKGECDKYNGCPHRVQCFASIFKSDANETKEEDEDMAAKKKTGLAAIKDKVKNLKSKKREEEEPEEEEEEEEDEDEEEEDEDEDEEEEDEDEEDGKAKLAALKKKLGKGKKSSGGKPATRKKLDEVEDEEEEEEDEEEEEEDEERPTRGKAAKTKKKKTKKSKTGCKVLCLNCAPTQGGESVRLETLLADALETIENETGKSWQLHDYRNGAGLVVDGLSTVDLPEILVVDTSTPLGKVCLEGLIPRAEMVVAGRV